MLAIKVEGAKSYAGMSIPDRARIIFRKLDSDNDGEITMEEFVEGYLRMHNPREASTSASGATVTAAHVGTR